MSTLQHAIGSVNSHDFMGRNGFYWWVGVVEDVMDPLRLGRARVRVFGIHHEDSSILPTADLPWAHALCPLANENAPKSPTPGVWVLGFFLDGSLAQQPVMLGVLPGYRFKDENSPFTADSSRIVPAT